MGRTRRSDRNYFRYAAIAFSMIFLMSSVLFVAKLWEKTHDTHKDSAFLEDIVELDGKSYVLKNNIETFLIIGIDKEAGTADDGGYENENMADFLMLVVFDNEAKTCSALQINRDTVVPVNKLGVAGNKINTVDLQIAYAYNEGNGKEVSCHNTADSVSALLMGMKVSHYLSLTMDAVPIINDKAGGVEVQVLDDFAGIDDSLVKGTVVTLSGSQALTYVRARKGMEDSTNLARMERQKQYVSALLEKVSARVEEDENFLLETVLELPENSMVSDRSNNQLQSYAEKFAEYEFGGVIRLEGKSEELDGAMAFYPDEDKLLETIVNLFYRPME